MNSLAPNFLAEAAHISAGRLPVAGVDEVGRGPLAGPVTAAAVVLEPDRIPEGLDDSKRVGRARRKALAAELGACAETSVAHADVDEIERLNILQAAHLAMARALDGLPRRVRHALIDGRLAPPRLCCSCDTIVGGDRLCLSIAAASIVAKVARDAVIVELAQQHPGYGWHTNAGYGTPEHLAALRDLGLTPHHRRTFRPVLNILWQAESATA
jgi:ribonuclease HII